ncbi:MAG: alpha/beta fold hydrolase [Gloeobacterales cyanobacterium]
MKLSNFNQTPKIPQIFLSLRRCLLMLSLGVSLSLATLSSAHAAKTVTIEYRAIGRTIPVSSIKAFVEQGTVDENLSYYMNLLNPEQRGNLRKALGNAPILSALGVDPKNFTVRLTQFLYDPMGVRLLNYTGRFIQTSDRDNGQQALRAAVILAAADPKGFSAMRAIEYFPSQIIRLKLDVALASFEDFKAEVEETLDTVSKLKQVSLAAAATEPVVDFATLPNLTQLGPFPFVSEELKLQDVSRNRVYPADVYRPENLNAVSGSIPVMVISHGFGDTRSHFAEFAKHLASYGFVVAVPEHIGSNTDQKEALISMRAHEAFRVREFIDRPLDISFLLDELGRLNETKFQGRLDLNNVAVMGHSFGGYTALALAGATINFESLQQQCLPNVDVVANLALLLECRALELKDSPEALQQLTQGFADKRVKLVMAFAPVSSLFGKSGMGRIQIPVVIYGGAYDVAAPVVPQQVKTFGWLTDPEKYLYLTDKTSHNAELTQWTDRLFNPGENFENNFQEKIQSVRGTLKVLVVAFSRVFLQSKEEYRPFLTSRYLENDPGKEQIPFYLIRELPKDLRLD